jgi:hypothetical protein
VLITKNNHKASLTNCDLLEVKAIDQTGILLENGRRLERSKPLHIRQGYTITSQTSQGHERAKMFGFLPVSATSQIALSAGVLVLLEIGRRIGVRQLAEEGESASKGLGAIFGLLGLTGGRSTLRTRPDAATGKKRPGGRVPVHLAKMPSGCRLPALARLYHALPMRRSNYRTYLGNRLSPSSWPVDPQNRRRDRTELKSNPPTSQRARGQADPTRKLSPT